MTTFDTSTGGLSGPGGQASLADIHRIQAEAEESQTPAERAEQDNAATPDAPLGVFSEGDTLALLTQRAREVQAAAAPERTVYGFNREFAITCEAVIAERQLRGWQKRALPKGKRQASAGNVSMFDMDQRRLALACLHDTARTLYVRRGVDARGVESWARIPVEDERGSIFDDAKVKQAFGAVDRDTVLNRIFGGADGPLIRAGNEIMAAAGWADEIPGADDDEDDDPYSELDPRGGR